MRELLGDVLVAQHRRVFELLDLCHLPRARRVDIDRFVRALLAHVTVEEDALAAPLRRLQATETHAEEHAVLRFLAVRLRIVAPRAVVQARVRFLRDLLVDHVDSEERVTLPAVERILGVRRSASVGARARTTFDRLTMDEGANDLAALEPPGDAF